MRGTISSKASLGLFSGAVLSLLETTGTNFLVLPYDRSTW